MDTQHNINTYFRYMAEQLNNNVECSDMQLLSSSALRSEFILRTCWRSLKKINFLDESAFDKVCMCVVFVYACVCVLFMTYNLTINIYCQTAQHGFISSLVHCFEVYLSTPGEILAQMPLSELLAYKNGQNGGNNNKYNYCGRDLFVLRR